MSHEPRTADTYYNVMNATENAVQMARFISSAMTGNLQASTGEYHLHYGHTLFVNYLNHLIQVLCSCPGVWWLRHSPCRYLTC